MRTWAAVAGAVLMLGAAQAAEPRFFVAGSGTLALVSAHSGERASVTYRRADGTYDEAALAALARVMRSRGDGAVGVLSPRFVELLGHLYDETGRAPLRIASGYRSPDYNEAIRSRGARAASASLHTEGMAADVAFPARDLHALWMRVRALECCGTGYYQAEGFLHVDVGQPRFWEPQTARVDENLSAGNARLFARTDYDIYRAGEPIRIDLHAMTVPPVRIGRTVEPGGRIVAPAPGDDGCIEADAHTRLVVRDVPVLARTALMLLPCEPRPEATPARVPTNPITIRPRAP